MLSWVIRGFRVKFEPFQLAFVLNEQVRQEAELNAIYPTVGYFSVQFHCAGNTANRFRFKGPQ